MDTNLLLKVWLTIPRFREFLFLNLKHAILLSLHLNHNLFQAISFLVSIFLFFFFKWGNGPKKGKQNKQQRNISVFQKSFRKSSYLYQKQIMLFQSKIIIWKMIYSSGGGIQSSVSKSFSSADGQFWDIHSVKERYSQGVMRLAGSTLGFNRLTGPQQYHPQVI